jgi:RNA polymerase sigma-70 factor (ECF subfamily)
MAHDLIESLMESPPEVTDDEIVSVVLAGTPAAFDQLVDRYWGRALRYASRTLANRADAEDATQEAFTRAYLGLGEYEPRGKFGGWFYRILVNECRGAALRRKHHEHDDLDTLEGRLAATQSTLDSGIDAGDEVDAALTRLEPLLREAFVLRYVEDMSYGQMAEATGAGESALRMRVKRARDRLREILGNRNT